MDKMKIFRSNELILSLHRFPENNFSKQQTWESFHETFTQLCNYGRRNDINLNLRLSWEKPPHSLEKEVHFINKIDTSNLRLALPTALAQINGDEAKTYINNVAQLKKDDIGLWLVSGAESDADNKTWNTNSPISSCAKNEKILNLVRKKDQVPLVLDAIYNSQNTEYLDARILDKI
jgi:hypothetical protein